MRSYKDVFTEPAQVDPTLTRAYHYDLPEALIAEHAHQRREAAKMMCVWADEATLEHSSFERLPELLKAGDLLVFNDTQVLPARLMASKETGGKVELFVLEVLNRGQGQERWERDGDSTLALRCMTRSSKPLKPGQQLMLEVPEGTAPLSVKVVRCEPGSAEVEVDWASSALALLERLGQMPLPPYIVKRRRDLGQQEQRPEDQEDYQTVYASKPGAVAAPTAGLHFSQALLEALEARGVERAFLTLHVGLGTFKPVTSERLLDHPMHSEEYLIDEALSEAIKQTKARGGRVIAVGTTVARVLEACARSARGFEPRQDHTDIFIYPGEPMRLCDGLITNFHLPESTLLAMVASAMGYPLMRQVYSEAIAQGYKFYSYGDGMLILPCVRS